LTEAVRLHGEDGPVVTDLVIRWIGDTGAADADAEDPFLIFPIWEVETKVGLVCGEVFLVFFIT